LTLILLVAATFGPAIAALTRGWHTTDGQVDRWVEANHLSLDPEARNASAAYLSRTRRFRATGFAAGWVLMVALSLVFVLPAVYVIAVTAGELTRTRPPGRAAVLRTHDIRSHLPRWALPLSLVATAATVISALSYDLVALIHQPTMSRSDEIMFMVATVVVSAIGWGLSALIAQRRFVIDSIQDATLEEAMRGSEIRSVLGPAIGLAVFAATFDFAALLEGRPIVWLWSGGMIVGAWVIARLAQWTEPAPLRP
jgi:hypothetical protein